MPIITKKKFQNDTKNELLFGRSTLEPEFQKVYDKLYKAVSKMEDEVVFDLRKFSNIKYTKIILTIKNILYPMLQFDHPEIFWLDHSKTSFEENAPKIIVKLVYNTDKAEKKYLLDSIYNQIDKIIELYKNKSDFDFAVAVMEWLTNNVDYNDTLAGRKGDRTIYFKENTAYGALIKNNTLCFGYSCAYSLILSKKGIPCRVVLGESKEPNMAGHAWNIAMIDGEWCHIDCTFCDYNGKHKKEFKVETNYAYFGLTDEQFTYYYNKNLVFAQNLPRCTSKQNNYFIRRGLSFGNYEFERMVEKLYTTFATSDAGKKMFQILLDRPNYNDAIFLAKLAQQTPIENYQQYLDSLCNEFYKQSVFVCKTVSKINITEIIMDTHFPVLTFTLDVTKITNPYLNNSASAPEPQKPTPKATPEKKAPATVPAKSSPTSTPAESSAPASTPRKAEGADAAQKFVLPSETLIPKESLERSKKDEAEDPLNKVIALIEVPSKYTFSIPFESFTVGAGSKCDLCVYTTGVEVCFVIYCDNGVWKIENKSNRSGHVFLDGKEVVGSRMLRENAFIRVEGSKSYRFTFDLDTWFEKKGTNADGSYRKQFVPHKEPLQSYLYELPEQKEYIIKPSGEISVNSNDEDDLIFVESINKMVEFRLDTLSCAWTIENISNYRNYVKVNGEVLESKIYLNEYDILEFGNKETVFRFIINQKDYKRKTD